METKRFLFCMKYSIKRLHCLKNSIESLYYQWAQQNPVRSGGITKNSISNYLLFYYPSNFKYLFKNIYCYRN